MEVLEQLTNKRYEKQKKGFEEWQIDMRRSLRIPQHFWNRSSGISYANIPPSFKYNLSGLQTIFLALQSLKLIMEERVLGKPPNPSTPCLHFTQLRLLKHFFNRTSIFSKLTQGLGNTKPPSHGGN